MSAVKHTQLKHQMHFLRTKILCYAAFDSMFEFEFAFARVCTCLATLLSEAIHLHLLTDACKPGSSTQQIAIQCTVSLVSTSCEGQASRKLSFLAISG